MFYMHNKVSFLKLDVNLCRVLTALTAACNYIRYYLYLFCKCERNTKEIFCKAYLYISDFSLKVSKNAPNIRNQQTARV